ncbi:MAG: adenylate/guanylate cyclase domain-containing protein [Planctomycetota bacterium]|nr:MAG: adenylate/guanylate cyclase domain-containing protein [Planctomycetota bacterium]
MEIEPSVVGALGHGGAEFDDDLAPYRAVLRRIAGNALQRLQQRCDILHQFKNEDPVRAYVVSIDIRKSTDLMLKATQPQRFAEFLLQIWDGFRKIICKNLGVFDKFTGDGVLAHFPEFFSGPDAGYRAISSAAECHALFDQQYCKNRDLFHTVLLDTGLGIGIDLGDVHLVEVNEELTVVGRPVVYACRFSGGPAGNTLLNQVAYEHLRDAYGQFVDFKEEVVDLKHEGRVRAYRVSLNRTKYNAVFPDWWGDDTPGVADEE